jgi:hypothetical protein
VRLAFNKNFLHGKSTCNKKKEGKKTFTRAFVFFLAQLEEFLCGKIAN